MRNSMGNRSRIALLLAAALVVSLVAAAAAYALTADSFRYSKPKTGYVRVSHMAFIPNTDFITWSQSHTGGLTTSGGNGCFNAGVNLPVGSKAKAVTWYYRSGVASDVEVSFRMNQLSTGVGSPIIDALTPSEDSNVPTSVTRKVPSDVQRVTAGRAYWLEACPGSDGAFFGARIKYTYMSAGS